MAKEERRGREDKEQELRDLGGAIEEVLDPATVPDHRKVRAGDPVRAAGERVGAGLIQSH